MESNFKTKRIKRSQAFANRIVCRAAAKGDGDTGALGLCYRCTGRQQHRQDFTFVCPILENTFKDVMPTAAETVGHVRFIYEREPINERRWLLMVDPSHLSIILSGVIRAFLYFKKGCNHLFHSLARRDGCFMVIAYDGWTGLPNEQVNEANNEGDPPFEID